MVLEDLVDVIGQIAPLIRPLSEGTFLLGTQFDVNGHGDSLDCRKPSLQHTPGGCILAKILTSRCPLLLGVNPQQEQGAIAPYAGVNSR